MRYGYIGLGNLGEHLAMSLLRAGFQVTVNDLNKTSAKRLLEAGAKWADTPRAVAEASAAVFTCLPSPKASEAVLTGPNGILAGLKKGGTWIENSTLGRDETLRLAAIAKEHGIDTLEAPVTGGVHLAAHGKITVLAGGDQDGRLVAKKEVMWVVGVQRKGLWFAGTMLLGGGQHAGE